MKGFHFDFFSPHGKKKKKQQKAHKKKKKKSKKKQQQKKTKNKKTKKKTFFTTKQNTQPPSPSSFRNLPALEVNHEMDVVTAWLGCPPLVHPGHTKVHWSREDFIFSFLEAGVADISDVNHKMDCRTAWLGCPPPGTAGHTKGTLFTRRGLCISSHFFFSSSKLNDFLTYPPTTQSHYRPIQYTPTVSPLSPFASLHCITEYTAKKKKAIVWRSNQVELSLGYLH